MRGFPARGRLTPAPFLFPWPSSFPGSGSPAASRVRSPSPPRAAPFSSGCALPPPRATANFSPPEFPLSPPGDSAPFPAGTLSFPLESRPPGTLNLFLLVPSPPRVRFSLRSLSPCGGEGQGEGVNPAPPLSLPRRARGTKPPKRSEGKRAPAGARNPKEKASQRVRKKAQRETRGPAGVGALPWGSRGFPPRRRRVRHFFPLPRGGEGKSVEPSCGGEESPGSPKEELQPPRGLCFPLSPLPSSSPFRKLFPPSGCGLLRELSSLRSSSGAFVPSPFGEGEGWGGVDPLTLTLSPTGGEGMRGERGRGEKVQGPGGGRDPRGKPRALRGEERGVPGGEPGRGKV